MMRLPPTHLQTMKLSMIILMRLPLIYLQMVEIMRQLIMIKGENEKGTEEDEENEENEENENETELEDNEEESSVKAKT